MTGGIVYVHGSSTLSAIDQAGVTNCGGTPKVCTPLWTTEPSAHNLAPIPAPTVGGGSVYLIDFYGWVYAYDATGTTGCAGSPAVCAPRWTAHSDGSSSGSFLDWVAPVLDGNRVLTYTTATISGSVSPLLSAYDAAGVTDCSGSPVTCTPVWSTPVSGTADNTQLAVAYGSVVVVTTDPAANKNKVTAFADTGAGCAGTPMTCQPQWTSTAELQPGLFFPVVANGTLYAVDFGGGIVAFDAHGQQNCASSPTICNPTATKTGIGASGGNFSVQDGRIFVVIGPPNNPSGAKSLEVLQ